MKYFFTSFLLFTFLINVNAQDYWQKLNSPPGGNISSIIFDVDNFVYAGATVGGMYRSSNNGETWTQINNGLIQYRIVAQAMGTNYHFVGTATGGVYRSSDKGNSWTEVNNGLSNLRVNALAFHNNHIFAGTDEGVFRSDDNGDNWTAVNNGLTNLVSNALISGVNYLFVGTNEGVFRTADNGDNWSTVNNGLSNIINTLTIDSGNLYAGTDGFGVYRSVNEGDSWSQVNNGLGQLNVLSLAISTSFVYAGTEGGIFRSSNNGGVWIQVNAGLTNLFTNALAVSGSNVFAGTNGGILRSSDSEDTWTPINNGIFAVNMLALVISENYIYAGANGGIYYSSDNGNTWTQVNIGLGASIVFSLANNETDIFAGTNNGIYRSKINENSWTQVNNGLSNLFANALAVSGEFIFAGTNDGVFRSSNNGNTWTHIQNGLTTSVIELTADNNFIYAGTNGGGVYRSAIGGDEWTQVNNGITNLRVRALASGNNYVYGGTNTGIYRSSNSGDNWSEANNGLTSLLINGLDTGIDYAYAGTDGGGVHRSSDNGANWVTINSGLVTLHITTIKMSRNGYLYAVTFDPSIPNGNGIYKTTQPVNKSITVISPGNGDSWEAGTQQTITWTSINVSENVSIKLSTDGGASFPITIRSNTANDGTENIEVPNNPSTTCVIRIESVNDSKVFANSSGNFTITATPNITVTEPSSSSSWIVGTQQNVLWNSTNVSGNVNIKLSTDGGNTFPITLKSNSSNDGNEVVDVPNEPSITCKIRVESVSDNNIFGLSEGNFSILAPTITVTAPSAAANWIVGTQETVTWTSENVTGNVNIKLSIDGGSTFPINLKTNIANDGSEVIQVPDNPSTTTIVKVESVNDNNFFGLSGTFTIVSAPTITVTSPSASANWTIGSQQTVAWASTNVTGDVNIKLSTDGGSTFPITIRANTSNDNEETIDVPDNPSTTCVVKVESAGDNSIFGLSDGNFTITAAPTITVTSPSESANWIIGTEETVNWSSVNIPGNINIKLSTDGGNTFPVVLKSNTPNDNNETVLVPDNPSTTCRIRVESVDDTTIFGLNPGDFSIAHEPSIIVTSPASSDTWTVGSQQTVSWTSINVIGNVNIKLSTDGGSTFPVSLKSNTPDDGNEVIDVTDNPSVSSVVKVESISDNNIFGLSESFTIISLTVTVTAPAASANWTIGSQQTVSWSSNVVGSMNIKLSTDGGSTFPVTLKSNTPNDNTEIITVPDNQSNTCRIKVESASNNNIFGLNPGDFTITSEPTITVTSPPESVKWTIGSQQNVSWMSVNVPGNVNIKLSTDGGSTFPIILKSDTPNDSSETIDVPDNQSETCRIRVEAVDDNNIFGLNPGDFIITSEPTITVTLPEASALWTIGSQQNISWSSVNVSGNVNIKLSTDGGSTFPITLKSDIPNDGEESIDVPDNPSATCRIKVESMNDNNIFGINPGNFTITSQPNITVTSPAASANWTIGSQQSVTWTSVGVTGNVNIKLSTDGGNTFPINLKSAIPNDGEELIDVPDNSSTVCRIKVESADDNNIYGLNPGDFTITSEATISVTSPAASANWAIGSQQNVLWTSVSVNGNVNIKLSTDGGSTFPISLKSDTPNDGEELVDVPDNASAVCRVKVESVDDTNIYGLNPGDFAIPSGTTASITVTSPSASLTWLAGSSQNVTWSSVNLTGNVNIRLSTDAGNTFPISLKTDTPDDGNEVVTVPNNAASNCRVKIESAGDNSIFDISDNNFSIAVYPSTITVSNTKSFPNVTDVKNYKIIGIPGNGSIPVAPTGEYEYDWKVYWDNGNDQNYLQGGANFVFTPGKAYWIISKNPFSVNQQVNAVALGTDNTYSITLHPGWNLISNPFDKTVNWANIRTLNGLGQNQRIYGWNGTWDSLRTQMLPYEGYYFNNTSGLTSLKIPYNPGGSLAKVSVNEEYPKNIHEFLKLTVNNHNGVEKSEIYVGFNPESKNEYDEHDYFSAPGDFQSTEINLVRKELPKRERNFFIEQRPSLDEGQEYDVEIKAVPDQFVNIDISGIEYFNTNEIYLMDERLKNFYNVKEAKSINLRLAHQNNSFKLYIGSKKYIEDKKQSISPLSYNLFQNYPNPFNPSTAIRFSLPETDQVTLLVFNILGETVMTLKNNEIYEAGNYEVRFDGSSLTTGIYILEMQTSNFKMQRKMVLLK